MSEISGFRMAKLLHVFNTFFDVNGSGEIDEKDLEIAIQKICEARGWGAEHPDYSRTRATLRALWNVLTARADLDDDKRVTVQEWYNVWQSPKPQEWSTTFRDLMFILEDSSGDGGIDVDEYIALYTALGVPDAVCRDAFSRAAKGGSRDISKNRFDELWEEYFYSEDKTAPGNFIFGTTKF